MLIKKINSYLPFLIIVISLVFVGGISFNLTRYVNSKSNTLVNLQTNEIPVTIQPSIIPSTTVLPSTLSEVKNTTHKKKIVTNLPTSNDYSQSEVTSTAENPVKTETTQAQSSTNITTNQPTTIPSPTISKISISLSVDEGSSFSLSLDEGNNHCDALSQALQEGKISSLNMQFNSSFNSYAVYKINGLGQEGQVWWTYKVNDKSPPLGCTHIKVQNNDNVRWTYVGPR